MRLGRYTFTCRFLDSARLPSYKGSTLRGAFGVALKKALCVNRRQACSDCLLACNCLYAATFERGRAAAELRQAQPPLPYIIIPPEDVRTDYVPGDRLEIGLNLFGSANDSLPYFVFAFDHMGEGGLGKRIDGRRGRFTLESVSCSGQTLYDANKGQLRTPDLPELTLQEPADEKGHVELSLHTPLRLKYSNQLQAELPFQLLVRALLRRLSAVLASYGGGEPPLDYRGLVHRAGSVRTEGASLRWDDWERYSNRQQQSMRMGGLVGTIRYAEVPGEYRPLLESCRPLHLGKQSTFGLGRYDYQWEPSK